MHSKIGTLWHQPKEGGQQLPIFFSKAEQRLMLLSQAPAVSKRISHTQTQIVEALEPIPWISERELLISQVTREDMQAAFGSARGADSFVIRQREDTLSRVWGVICDKANHKAKNNAEKRYIAIRKLSEILRYYRKLYAQNAEHHNLKKAHDNAYFATRDERDIVPKYLLLTPGFQSLLGKICYHSDDIRLEENMVLINAKKIAWKDKKEKRERMEDVIPQQAIMKKTRHYVPQLPHDFDELADARRHAAELMEGLNEEDY